MIVIISEIYVVCPKSTCTDVLFKCTLDSPEIISYLLQSRNLGKFHSGSNVLSIDCSGIGSNFLSVFLAHRSQSQNDGRLISIST
jgi:hypothetical protein